MNKTDVALFYKVSPRTIYNWIHGNPKLTELVPELHKDYPNISAEDMDTLNDKFKPCPEWVTYRNSKLSTLKK